MGIGLQAPNNTLNIDFLRQLQSPSTIGNYDIFSGMGNTSSIGLKAPGFANSKILGGGQGLQPLKFGMNIPTLEAGAKGISALAQLWGALQASSLGKKQFNMQRDFANRNYENTALDYNTKVYDDARRNLASRGAGMSGAELDAAAKQYASSREVKPTMA